MHVRLSLLVAALLLPSLVAAEEARTIQVVTYPPGDDKIVVVRKGEPAPFTGQLYDDNTAVRWAIWLQQYKGRYAIDVKAVEDACEVKLDAADELAQIEEERTSTIHADAMLRLKESETARLKAEEQLRNPDFFDRPGVWFTVGVVSTLATVLTTAYLVDSATK
jgi:hypothetical protein